jgi:hypothetical protein
MTRLINFGLGEICDRLSILALKILHAEQKGADVTMLRNERAALMVKLLTRDGGRWIEFHTDLAAVNATIWQAEEELRSRREALKRTDDEGEEAEHHYHAGALGLRILDLTDRRTALVNQINAYVGDEKAAEVV